MAAKLLPKLMRGAVLGALVAALGGCYYGPPPYAYSGPNYYNGGYYSGPGYYRPYHPYGYGAPSSYYQGDYTNGTQQGR